MAVTAYSVESIEHTADFCQGDARARIFDAQAYAQFGAVDVHANRRAFGRVLARVQNQVAQQDAKRVLVPGNGLRGACKRNALILLINICIQIADDGLGKRTSAYEYRVSGRGGQGVTSMDLSRGRGGEAPRVVAAFPIEENDELVLVTDGGQLIRSPVHDIRIAGRATRGVTLFRVGEAERVVSVARLEEDDEAGEDENGDDEAGNGTPEGPEGENS